MSRILVVDDELNVVRAFEELLVDQGHQVETAHSGDEALAAVKRQAPDLIISDICMPGMSGIATFRLIQQLHPRLPVIFMTGQGSMESAIEATKLGAYDYQLKPFDPEEMLKIIQRALEDVRLMQRGVEMNPEVAASMRDAIIGAGPAMHEVFKAIGRVAPTDATVLIRGETGVGKELVARAIYHHSRRAESPLSIVNCVAIPEALLESELFGYERGAFTGAANRRIGKFEQARGGTIFLDEIGDIGPSAQAKILRVLQERTFERVGGNETFQADVRVLAATNRPLEEAIAEGTFREDLYYRLNVVTVNIPPLRDRSEDVLPLVEYFLSKYALELGIDRPVLADDARELIAHDPWPGNVRELEHCIYRAMIFTHGYPIQATDIQQARETPLVEGARTESTVGGMSVPEFVRRYLDSQPGPQAHDSLLEQIDRSLIVEALRRSGGNQSKAARMLGLARPTLHAKMRKYDLHAQ